MGRFTVSKSPFLQYLEMSKKRGRPAKLGTYIIYRIVESILDGASPAEAAILSKIQPRTLRGWLERGKSSTDGIFRELYDAVTRAEQEYPKLVYRRVAA